MMPSPVEIVGTLAWGTVVGLDLVSVPQGLLSRPLVAATVTGLLVGNITGGLMAGMVLELYALDVLPIGASRYPDYSVAAVAGGVAGALVTPTLAVGVAGLIGLPMAAVGGWTLQTLRRRNAPQSAPPSGGNLVPVIYRLNLREANSFFLARSFIVKAVKLLGNNKTIYQNPSNI